MNSLTLLADPGYRLPLIVGLLAVTILSWLAIYLAGSRLLLTGMALAQVASAGAALSLLVPVPSVILATLATAVAATASAFLRQRQVTSDAGLLVLYLGGAVAAQLLAASSGSGDSQILDLLNGQLLLATSKDAIALGIAALALLAFIPGRQSLLLIFSQRAFAHDCALPIGRFDALVLLVVGVVVGAIFPILGVLCTTAALTCPGLIALTLAQSLRQTLWIAATVALGAYVLGILIAFACDWPPGPVIAGVYVTATIASLQRPNR